MIKKRIARLSASVALFMIMLMLALPLFAFTAGAESFITDWTTDRSGKIHQIVDNAELTDDQTHFSLSYNVKGGRDFRFRYDLSSDIWEGEVKASPGDVITVGYKATYGTLKDLYVLDSVIKDYTENCSCSEEINDFRDETVNKPVHEKTTDNTDGSPISGSFTLNVPEPEENSEENGDCIMSVSSNCTITNKIDGSKVSPTLSYSISVIVDKSTAVADVGGITQNASTDNGETGVAIPAAIVLGTLSAGAGIVGAAAAAVSKPTDKKDGGGSFKMLVGKNFGDGIRKGAKPVKLWARMVEVKDGKQQPRPDLNSNITVSGQDVNIISASVTGSRVEVMVSVDEACQSETAIITFIYNGAGGTFRNNVVFKVVGNPYLQYDTEPEEGYVSGPYPEAIFGDNLTYKMKFTIAETTGYPSDIRAKSLNPELDVTLVRDETVEYGYVITIVNKTKESKENKIFFEGEKRIDCEIKAVFGDGTKIVSKNGLILYPEGLLVSAPKIEDERIPIKSYDLDDFKDVSDRFSGEKFNLILAVKGKLGAEVFKLPKDGISLKFCKNLSGDTRINNSDSVNVAKKYKFKLDPAGNGLFYFIPKSELYQPKKETVYAGVLDAECTYNGVRYVRYIPFRLIGKLPDPMGNWKTEYANLKRRIEKFSLPAEKDSWLQKLDTCALDPPVSVDELRMVSKEILRRYMNYWTKQNAADFAEVAHYERVLYVLDWVKFIGDCAFSYLVQVYAGPIADAIITPAKDIFIYAIGEWNACRNYGTKFDYRNLEIYEKLNTAGDLVSQKMLKDGIKTNPKQWFYYIAGYLVLSIFRNYCTKLNTEGVSDFYGAIKASFKDLTVSAFKIIAGELFQKWLKSEQFQKMAGGKISEFLSKKVYASGIKVDVNVNKTGVDIVTQETIIISKYSDAVAKFLVRTVGMGTTRIIKKFSGSQLSYNENGNPAFCFPIYEPITGKPIYIELDLVKCLACNSAGPLSPFVYIFDMFFSGISGARSAISFPKDPPIERTQGMSK